VTLRDALVRSKNVATVRLADAVGLGQVADAAHRAGIDEPLPELPSIALGTVAVSPLELTTAYTAFAGLGTGTEPRMILSVEDEDGKVLWKPDSKQREVLDPGISYLVTDVLTEALERGTGIAALRSGLKVPAAGKTGTTNDGADAWFVGYTPDLVTGVWIGFDQPRAILEDATGGRLAAPIWGRMMERLYVGRRPPAPWHRPDSVVARSVDPAPGLLLKDGCAPVSGAPYEELFLDRAEPKAYCPGREAPPADGFPTVRLARQQEAAERAHAAQERAEKQKQEEARRAELARQEEARKKDEERVARAKREAEELAARQARLDQEEKRLTEREAALRREEQKKKADEQAERKARLEQKEKELATREAALRREEEKEKKAAAEKAEKERLAKKKEEDEQRAERARKRDPESRKEDDDEAAAGEEARREPRRAEPDEDLDDRREEPVDDLSGWWELSNQIQETNYEAYLGLRLGYRLHLEQDGNHITGRGQKWSEDGRSVPAGGRTPLTVRGTVEGGTVHLDFTEHGAKRSTSGSFEWRLAPDGSTLRGSFWSTAAATRGRSVARRLE
jgi:membrane peptidoglycan carboxypeptidase